MNEATEDPSQDQPPPSALGLLIAATGVVYGDIGTSPLSSMGYFTLPVNRVHSWRSEASPA